MITNILKLENFRMFPNEKNIFENNNDKREIAEALFKEVVEKGQVDLYEKYVELSLKEKRSWGWYEGKIFIEVLYEITNIDFLRWLIKENKFNWKKHSFYFISFPSIQDFLDFEKFNWKRFVKLIVTSEIMDRDDFREFIKKGKFPINLYQEYLVKYRPDLSKYFKDVINWEKIVEEIGSEYCEIFEEFEDVIDLKRPKNKIICKFPLIIIKNKDKIDWNYVLSNLTINTVERKNLMFYFMKRKIIPQEYLFKLIVNSRNSFDRRLVRKFSFEKDSKKYFDFLIRFSPNTIRNNFSILEKYIKKYGSTSLVKTIIGGSIYVLKYCLENFRNKNAPMETHYVSSMVLSSLISKRLTRMFVLRKPWYIKEFYEFLNERTLVETLVMNELTHIIKEIEDRINWEYVSDAIELHKHNWRKTLSVFDEFKDKIIWNKINYKIFASQPERIKRYVKYLDKHYLEKIIKGWKEKDPNDYYKNKIIKEIEAYINTT